MRRQIAFYTAVLATAASLHTQFVAGWSPCGICTLQRVFMYPLVGLTLAGIYDRWRADRLVVPVAVLGGLLSLIHHLHVRFDPTQGCGFWLPCHMDQALGIGPVLIRPMYVPLGSAIAFTTIAVLWYTGGDDA